MRGIGRQGGAWWCGPGLVLSAEVESGARTRTAVKGLFRRALGTARSMACIHSWSTFPGLQGAESWRYYSLKRLERSLHSSDRTDWLLSSPGCSPLPASLLSRLLICFFLREPYEVICEIRNPLGYPHSPTGSTNLLLVIELHKDENLGS